MNELALFAGAGGGILGGQLLGWKTVCAVEIEEYPASVLMQRQNDGFLPTFPIWDDVRTFDGRPWRGIVDVVSGGFPCQDISVAGKGAGIEGERSGMWVEMARIIREVQPRYVFVENSPMLTSRGLGVVLGDLAELGFNARWGVLGAADTGAKHERKRIWIVGFNADKSYATGIKFNRGQDKDFRQWPTTKNKQEWDRWEHELGTTYDVQKVTTYGESLRELHGMADRVDRLKALGNGQVPQCAAEAWRILTS